MKTKMKTKKWKNDKNFTNPTACKKMNSESMEDEVQLRLTLHKILEYAKDGRASVCVYVNILKK